MLVKVFGVAIVGMNGEKVEIEVDVSDAGFPDFTIVGLADKAVNEAKDRVKSAIKNSGMTFPAKKITVNMAPADLPKIGSMYDLPIAVGIMMAGEEIPADSGDGAVFCGELGLGGECRHTRGGLIAAMLAKEMGVKKVFCPIESANEAAVVDGVEVYPVRSLAEWVKHVRGVKLIEKLQTVEVEKLLVVSRAEFDMGEILGQELAKRALVIAAAGGHNMLMVGPPGTGKTMLARAMPSILPPLTVEESMEVTKIYSVAGMMKSGEAIVRQRPFRSPHTSVSMAGLVGGGSKVTPGEAVLAHCGVLFLDEVAEFSRSVLESLRQPMEDGRVVIARAGGKVEYPSKFQLIAAANPCPCGNYGHPTKECVCGEGLIDRYRRRISGPIIDRIDLQVNVMPVESFRLVGGDDDLSDRKLESEKRPKSEEIRAQVIEARKKQIERFGGSGIFCNAQMRNKEVSKFCVLDGESKRLLQMAIDKYEMSARGYQRLLKVARTIADLMGDAEVKVSHLAEALQYRERVF